MSKSKKWQYGQIGSISSATMRPEDLIPCFVDELRSLGHRDKELSAIERRLAREDNHGYSNHKCYWDSEDSTWDLDSLFDMLDEHSLPYMYFGAHPGNGSDYGFWLFEDFENDFEGLKVNDTSEVPNDYLGEVLHVNDHGNVTLYVARRGKLTEIWAVV